MKLSIGILCFCAVFLIPGLGNSQTVTGKKALSRGVLSNKKATVLPKKSLKKKARGTASGKTEYRERGDYVTAKRTKVADYVSVDCPERKVLIAGGCQGVGGDGILMSKPQGNSWICQFEPRRTPLEKTAFAICSTRPEGYRTLVQNASANLVYSNCESGRTLISGGCSGVGGDAVLASKPNGDTWICQFEPRSSPLNKEAKSICASRPGGYQTVTRSARENLVNVSCPTGKQLISGGCSGVGGDALLLSMPQGNTWICSFKPRTTPLQKTATAVCVNP